jgi:xanthine dehydrogenase accessory factor
MFSEIVVIRSGGDIGSAVAHKLHRSGFKVLILEIPKPLAIRRRVAFCEAIFDDEVCVEGVYGKRVQDLKTVHEAWNNDSIPVLVDGNVNIIKKLEVHVLVDAILAKKNINTSKDMAAFTIGLGPGFTAGKDVHAVIETNRGHDLGRIIFSGEAEKDTGIPGVIQGYAEERILRASASGIVKGVKDIGELVEAEEVVLYVGEYPVTSRIKGVIRGCIRDGMEVTKGMKIGDVDPRGNIRNCYTISDKARCIAGGVLEAILNFKK